MQNSNVLVIGNTCHQGLDFGADFVDSFDQAKEYLLRHQPSVLVFGVNPVCGDAEEFSRFALDASPDALWIVACEQTSPAQLMQWKNFGRLFDIIDNLQDHDLETKLQSALEASGESAQGRKLIELFEDQSLRLKRLSSELESRVQRRHRSLRKSLQRLEETRTRLEAFHRAFLGIHRASSVLQIEKTLNNAIGSVVDLKWVKVRFENQSLLQKQTVSHILALELPFRHEQLRGEVLFGKEEGKSFSADESDFLYELSDAVALSLARLHTLEEAETLKGQWQATFDSIPHPLCLVNHEFEIIKLNRAFQQACPQQTFLSLLGKNCFRVFFGDGFKIDKRKEDRASTQGPLTFRATRTGIKETEHYEIIAQQIGLTHDNQNVQLILLRAITEEVRFERRILETSKLAELGTIGSSIAHELNNPLGGMLSFLQLILMDLSSDARELPDIKAMEQAVLRCRDIVQNLLSFARKQDLGEFQKINLWDIVERSVRLIELQSKSIGISIVWTRSAPKYVQGSSNALSQALCNLLQNSLDAISERVKSDPRFNGEIRLEVFSDNKKCHLRVSDNGQGIRPEVQTQIFNPLFTTRDPRLRSGMGLTTALTIVSEHEGSLEILSQTGSWTTATISLPRLDESPESTDF